MADDALIIDILTGKDEVTFKFEQIDEFIKRIDVDMQKFNKRVQMFDMRWLSVLFTGMALQRTFGRALRDLTNTFIKAEDNTSALGKATLQIGAAWDFLKFSIMDALNTDFFIGVIEGITNTINWLSELIDKFPEVGQAIIVAFGVLAVGGTIMVTIGTFQLFWLSVFGPYGLLATNTVAGLGTVAGTAGTVAGALFAFLTKIAPGIIGVGIMIPIVLSLNKEGKDKLDKLNKLFKTPKSERNAVEDYLYGGLPGSSTVVPDYVKQQNAYKFNNILGQTIETLYDFNMTLDQISGTPYSKKQSGTNYYDVSSTTMVT